MTHESVSGWAEGPAIFAKLADFAERYKKSQDSITEEEWYEINTLIQKNGRRLTEGSGLYSEHTSENIAFIKLSNGLSVEVSISGSFNASFVEVLDDAEVKERLAEIEQTNKE